MTGKNHVYIIEMKEQPAGKKLRVRPAIASVDLGETSVVKIRNVTDYDALIDLDVDMVGAGNTHHEIVPMGAADVPIKAGASGFYRYSVKLRKSNKSLEDADGESAPGMIIDP